MLNTIVREQGIVGMIDAVDRGVNGVARLEYSRIVSATQLINEGMGDGAALEEMEANHAEIHDFTPPMLQGLIETIRTLNRGGTVNCHRFPRIVGGLDKDSASWEKHSPLVSDYTESKRVETLPIGRFGVVGITAENGSQYVPHSVVGLDEQSETVVHVLSMKGELAISGIPDTLDFYANLFPNREVGLYRI